METLIDECEKALQRIEILLSGSRHTMFPINVREPDGSISMVRPESNEGKAYNTCREILAKIKEARKE